MPYMKAGKTDDEVFAEINQATRQHAEDFPGGSGAKADPDPGLLKGRRYR